MPTYEVNEEKGNQSWYLNGKRHREDGPAIISGDYQAWYLNGKRHREDGPAIINGNYQAWYLNGKRHREDGPAIIDEDNNLKEWWVNGEQITEYESNKQRSLVREMTVAELSELLGYTVKIVM